MRSNPDNRTLEVIYGHPTRGTALDLLSDFLPRVREYAAQRNFDVPGHPHVSCLSPAITLRLITEHEVIAQVAGACGRTASRRYVDEVLWRCYWKGWLELRPAVWQSYLDTCDELLLHMDARTRYLYQSALRGETGIDCFDSWMHELQQSGYLHNHARMWFASIWVFRLGLPWQLGARLFLSELLDGDPASNTLSWRWLPRGTHRWKDFVTPEEVCSMTAANGLRLAHQSGVWVNPVTRDFSLCESMQVNYMMIFEKL